MASKQSRIVELASIISVNTAKIDQYLIENNLIQPSFDVNGLTSLTLPLKLQENREEVLNATLELQELLLGPKETIADYQYNYLIAVQGVCKYNIVNTFPPEGEVTLTSISKACDPGENDVRRMVRFAASHRIFKEVRKGVVVHTAFSKLLATNTQSRDYCETRGEIIWPAASQVNISLL